MKAMHVVAVALALAWTGAQAADEPAKADPKKVEAKKTDAKKAEPKKTAPSKKTEPKKAEPKKAEPKKGEPVKTADPNVKVYKANDPNAPKLRDKDGKVIPTSPDAYDVSSALKK